MKISCSCGASCCSRHTMDINEFMRTHASCLSKGRVDSEPPAVTRAREILEECGIVDVQGTPADQLRPLVELIELSRHLSEALNDKMAHLVQQGGPEPDATITVARGLVQSTLVELHESTEFLPRKIVYRCYRVSK